MWWARCHRDIECHAWRTARMSSMTSWKCVGKKRQRRGRLLTTYRASWMISILPRRGSISSNRSGCGDQPIVVGRKSSLGGANYLMPGPSVFLVPGGHDELTQEEHAGHRMLFLRGWPLLGVTTVRIQTPALSNMHTGSTWAKWLRFRDCCNKFPDTARTKLT